MQSVCHLLGQTNGFNIRGFSVHQLPFLGHLNEYLLARQRSRQLPVNLTQGGFPSKPIANVRSLVSFSVGASRAKLDSQAQAKFVFVSL